LPAFSAALANIVITIPTGFSIAGNSTCIASVGVCTPSSTTQYTVTGVGLSLNNFIITLK
jgi:hypothetical protein